MDVKYTIFILSIFAIFLLSGCSSTKQVTTQDPDWQEAPEETEQPPVMIEEPEEIQEPTKEPPFDPVEFADDGLLVPRQQISNRPVINNIESEPVSGNIDSIESELKFEELERQGYRIQIFSTSDNSVAKEVEQQASIEFSESVYVTYDPPYYKVRVGDCLEREKADNLRRKAVSIGYRDAWVVRDKIKVKIRKN